MRRNSVSDFIAEFPTVEVMKKVLERENVTAPAEWEEAKDNFKVDHDGGRVLRLAFWDWDNDKQVGNELFEVGFDEVECWA